MLVLFRKKGVKESRIEIPLLNSKWKLSKNNLAATQNTLSLIASFLLCLCVVTSAKHGLAEFSISAVQKSSQTTTPSSIITTHRSEEEGHQIKEYLLRSQQNENIQRGHALHLGHPPPPSSGGRIGLSSRCFDFDDDARDDDDDDVRDFSGSSSPSRLLR